MRPAGWLLVGAVGFAIMAVASVWAPLQPEMIPPGAACQIAPCGMLEDPDRWRRAWWLWSVGALVAVVAAPFVLAPRRPSWRGVLLLVVCAVLLIAPVAGFAYVLSLFTSVQGGATVAMGVAISGVAVLGSWARTCRGGS